MNKKILLLLVLFLLTIYIYKCRGINMQCPLCFKNGHHMHISEFSINTNHGPKKKWRI